MKERNYYKKRPLHERKVHIKKKEKFHIMNLLNKGKCNINDFWE